MHASFAPLPDSHFHVPYLDDRPQNPILDTLRITRSGLRPKSVDNAPVKEEQPAKQPFIRPPKPLPTSRVVSWDSSPMTSPFLSERGEQLFSAARYVVKPSLMPNNHIRASRAELVYNANMTVLGLSSTWYTWNQESEEFIQEKVIILDGYDTVLTESILHSIVSIGTMLRRLEYYTHSLTQERTSAPTLYAFNHAMSEIIAYFREQVSCPFTESSGVSFYEDPLSTLIAHFEPYEQALITFVDMFGRSLALSPPQYDPPSDHPAQMLSMVFDYLKREIIIPNRTCMSSCLLAFLLTSTSRPFFQSIAESLGHTTGAAIDREDLGGGQEELFPTFFSPELVAAILTARKSLKLTEAPQSDIVLPSIGWIWSAKDVEHLLNSRAATPDPSTPNLMVSSPMEPSNREYDPAIRSSFSTFDQDPSEYINQYLPSDRSSLTDFISRFPDRLPSLTPSLQHLANLILSPLLQRCNAISNALLSTYLLPPFSTSPEMNLNFHSHATALRSFILCTSPQFSARLANSLLSDVPDEDSEGDERFSIAGLRRIGRQKQGSEKKDRASWPVGLSHDLLMRETWPPYGADLSFSLRTVIVETINELRSADEQNQKVWDDVESRLGFAVKDTGEDEGRWEDAFSIRALDFLYLDYKPPGPLEVLITPAVLAKYQRMFSFTLRIRRVNAALTQTHRLTRNANTPPFPTLAETNARCIHMRFISQSFVNALSSYVTDMAAGAMFDSFLSLLQPTPSNPSTIFAAYSAPAPAFTDVFELAQRHSDALDGILAACLLRSGQRSAANLISDALDCVLQFALLIRRRTAGILEEYEAKTHLEDLEKRFRTKMRTLFKVLEALAETKSANNREGLKGGREMSTNEMWKHLVVRLSLNSWWAEPTAGGADIMQGVPYKIR